VVKAHPAHPGTCELLGRAIVAALKQCSMPAGAFSLLYGAGHEVGLALVRHPAACAVAFTGSLAGGRALFDAAAARPAPIPVYAEMGSVNPVFLLPDALAERGDAIAAGYVQSVTLGVGQFCTNPGLVVGLSGEPLNRFIAEAGRLAAEAAPATMLHRGIRDSFTTGVSRLRETAGVAVAGEASAPPDDKRTQAGCVLFSTDTDTFENTAHLHDEVFGPSSIIVRSASPDELEAIAEGLEGHLTATIHGTEQDLRDHARLVRILERKVGRLVFNGFPTGVEVCAAMHHGGPYPATTHSHFTSIGAASILRFVRPLAYQDWPDQSLPVELRNRNERGLWRMVDGEVTRGDV
jgi:NADP-dependent aldehyde dehydrogenase